MVEFRQVLRQPDEGLYGDDATQENDWGFDWLPRVTGDHSHFGYWLDMADGKIEACSSWARIPRWERPMAACNAKLWRS